jgi:hypothetical protein
MPLLIISLTLILNNTELNRRLRLFLQHHLLYQLSFSWVFQWSLLQVYCFTFCFMGLETYFSLPEIKRLF